MNISKVLKEFENLFTKINIQYIRDSGLFDKEIQVLYDKKQLEVQRYLKDKNLQTVGTAVEGNKEHALKECIQEVYERHKNKYDPRELKEVACILGRIDGAYDLSDGRVYVIIKQLIDMTLSTMRINQQSVNMPTLMERLDNEGGHTNYYNHPSLKLKLEHNMAIVKLITELNKMIEGEKITTTINLDSKVFSRKELYGDEEPKILRKIN